MSVLTNLKEVEEKVEKLKQLEREQFILDTFTEAMLQCISSQQAVEILEIANKKFEEKGF